MALNRRELIQSGLLVPAVGSLISESAIADHTANAIWLIDDELPDALAVAAEAAPAAAAVHVFSSDPGQVWMNVLAPRLRAAPAAIAGYTSASTLFCLEYLARDRGLTLAAFGRGPTAPTPSAGTTPIDLREPGLADSRAACTWLLLPRRT